MFDIKYVHYQVGIILYNFYYIIQAYKIIKIFSSYNTSYMLYPLDFAILFEIFQFTLPLVSLKTLSSLYKNYVYKTKFIIKLKREDTHTDS